MSNNCMTESEEQILAFV